MRLFLWYITASTADKAQKNKGSDSYMYRMIICFGKQNVKIKFK